MQQPQILLPKLQETIDCLVEFITTADVYLSKLPAEAYFNDHVNGEISRTLDRMNRLRLELVELQRKIV